MCKNNPLISVIVPVYNVEAYLEKCLDSIIQQTYWNLEILVVDDGSTDRSGYICDVYQKKDNRIKVFHKKNEGLAEARNVALKNASGDYIACVDSDDYIEKDMYEMMLVYMDESVDIVTCGMNNIFPRSLRIRNYVSYKTYGRQKFNNHDAIRELLLTRSFSFSSCDKLFRRELFTNVKYPKGCICEDVPVLYQLFCKARNVVNIGSAKYNYIYRSNSISRKPFYAEKTYFAIFARDIELDVQRRYPKLKDEAEALFLNNVVSVLENLIQSEDRRKYFSLERKLRQALKRRVFHIWSNKNISDYRKKYYYQLIVDKY